MTHKEIYSILGFAILGVFFAISFICKETAFLTWLLPGLFLLGICNKRICHTAGSSLKLGWLFGFSFWLVSLRWLLFMPFPTGAVAGWLFLSAYLSIYNSLWSFGLYKSNQLLKHWQIISGVKIFILTLFASITWIFLEWIRSWLISGFTWNELAISQIHFTTLTQLASVTGSYGISFIIVAFSCSLALEFSALCQSKSERKESIHFIFNPLNCTELKQTILWLLLILGINLWGFKQIQHFSTEEKNNTKQLLQVLAMQPSIPQLLIWNDERAKENFTDLLKDAETVLKSNKIDLLILPESAVPGLVRYEESIFNSLSEIAKNYSVPILFCSEDMEPDLTKQTRAIYLNSAFLMSSSGHLVERYIKNHLVIFGEYVPLLKYLPFLKNFTPITGQFTSGKELNIAPPPTFRISPDVSTPKNYFYFQPLICFEDIFASEVKQLLIPHPSKLLICMVNDAWFKESSAGIQHLNNARLRAIENRIHFIRCCNNGITCHIDPMGRICEMFKDDQGNPHGKGHIIFQIPF